VAHLTEQSLRTLGDPHALRDREQALEDRFVELAGETIRVAVRAYTILTLVRHIYLSTQFTERRPFTECLLQVCEKRLGNTLVSMFHFDHAGRDGNVQKSLWERKPGSESYVALNLWLFGAVSVW
jgi:hypothetical protein